VLSKDAHRLLQEAPWGGLPKPSLSHQAQTHGLRHDVELRELRIPTVSTISNLAKTTISNLTTVTSHHDEWKTNTLNTPQVKLNIIKMERLA
jgi:hypothetical protein